jgi:hypothetical protein
LFLFVISENNFRQNIEQIADEDIPIVTTAKKEINNFVFMAF